LSVAGKGHYLGINVFKGAFGHEGLESREVEQLRQVCPGRQMDWIGNKYQREVFILPMNQH
jgi:hypothetical protein